MAIFCPFFGLRRRPEKGAKMVTFDLRGSNPSGGWGVPRPLPILLRARLDTTHLGSPGDGLTSMEHLRFDRTEDVTWI